MQVFSCSSASEWWERGRAGFFVLQRQRVVVEGGCEGFFVLQRQRAVGEGGVRAFSCSRASGWWLGTGGRWGIARHCLVAAPSSAMKSFAFPVEKKCYIFLPF